MLDSRIRGGAWKSRSLAVTDNRRRKGDDATWMRVRAVAATESSCFAMVRVMAAKGGMRPHFNAGFWKLIHTEAGGIREVAGMGNSPAEEERCGTRAGKHKRDYEWGCYGLGSRG